MPGLSAETTPAGGEARNARPERGREQALGRSPHPAWQDRIRPPPDALGQPIQSCAHPSAFAHGPIRRRCHARQPKQPAYPGCRRPAHPELPGAASRTRRESSATGPEWPWRTQSAPVGGRAGRRPPTHGTFPLVARTGSGPPPRAGHPAPGPTRADRTGVRRRPRVPARRLNRATRGPPARSGHSRSPAGTTTRLAAIRARPVARGGRVRQSRSLRCTIAPKSVPRSFRTGPLRTAPGLSPPFIAAGNGTFGTPRPLPSPRRGHGRGPAAAMVWPVSAAGPSQASPSVSRRMRFQSPARS